MDRAREVLNQNSKVRALYEIGHGAAAAFLWAVKRDVAVDATRTYRETTPCCLTDAPLRGVNCHRGVMRSHQERRRNRDTLSPAYPRWSARGIRAVWLENAPRPLRVTTFVIAVERPSREFDGVAYIRRARVATTTIYGENIFAAWSKAAARANSYVKKLA